MPHYEPLGALYSQPNPAGILRLSRHLLDRFPGTYSGGWYNPQSSLSGGGPSPHRVTQALDVMCDRATAAQIIRYMVQIAESVNLQQVIAWHEIVTVQRWAEGIRNYPADDHSGGNGHAHIHVGIRASRLWEPSWIGGLPPTDPPPAQPAGPARTDVSEEAVQTIHYPFPGQEAFHTFWIDGQGHLRHTWEPQGGGLSGYEDMTTKFGVHESLIANRGLSVFIGPKLDLFVRGVAADGACLEFRWAAAGSPPSWGVRVVGR